MCMSAVEESKIRVGKIPQDQHVKIETYKTRRMLHTVAQPCVIRDNIHRYLHSDTKTKVLL